MTRKDLVDIFSPYITMRGIANLYWITVSTLYTYSHREKPISKAQVYKILAWLDIHKEHIKDIERKLKSLKK